MMVLERDTRPAAVTRALMVVLLVTGTATPAVTAQAQDRDLESCAAIADVGQRVACYDGVTRSRAASATTSPSAPPAPIPAPRDARRDFGLPQAVIETQRPMEERVPDSIATVVASARIVGAGYWELTMTDGSVWRFAEVRTAFRSPRAGENATIRQGAVGSFHLQLPSQPTVRAVRVR